jgi:hypothetical protein
MSVPNSKNINSNALEATHNNFNSFELLQAASRVPYALKQILNIGEMDQLDKKV